MIGIVVSFCHVGNLDRLPAFGSLADSRFAQINRRLMDCAQKLAAKVMAGNDIESLTGWLNSKMPQPSDFERFTA